MILTVEIGKKEIIEKKIDRIEVEIYCDEKGIDLLIDELIKLKKYGGHTHLMTPSWAGNELTEEKQGGDENILVNHLCIIMKPE